MNAPARPRLVLRLGLFLTLALVVSACGTPIAAHRVGSKAVHEVLNANILTHGEPSDASMLVLRRAHLEAAFEEDPESALLELHDLALQGDEVDRLFALTELSFVLAERNGDRRRYLASAVYGYMLLFGEDVGRSLTRFDARQRVACDLYNRALVGAFASEDGEEVELRGGTFDLPVGSIEIEFIRDGWPWPENKFSRFLPAAEYQVEGLRARARTPGLGAPLIATSRQRESQHEYRNYLPRTLNLPATAFLRPHGGIEMLGEEPLPAYLELYYPLYVETVLVDGARVPLETDVTAPLALTLQESGFFDFEILEFLSADNTSFENGIFMLEPYQRFKIPVVFVHGTASSPARWAEMFHELQSDPVLRQRFQFWFFIYSTGNPITYSAATLRDALIDVRANLDPESSDTSFDEMVVVGHSQGGLLTRLMATDSGDAFWRLYSDKSIDELDLPPERIERLRSAFFFEPLPFVKKTVFIATPHRGSFMAGGILGEIASALISLPALPKSVFEGVRDVFVFDPLEDMPTAVDNMKPGDPFVRALNSLPIAPGVGVHSIVAIDGDETPPDGDDGVVEYTSAHLAEADSEVVVRSFHSVQDHPSAVAELRKILHRMLVGDE